MKTIPHGTPTPLPPAFWDPYYSNVGAFDIVPEVSETILVEELEGFEQILKIYFLHS